VSVTVVCPGSFDPVTYGHLDVIERAAARFDRLLVAVLHNRGKEPMFPLTERMELLREVTGHLDNVEVASFQGLLVDFCRDRDIHLVVRGLRAVSDFEYELQLAQMNGNLGDVETLFLTTSPEWSFLSSSLVKEVARWGGDIADFVPPVVADRLRQSLSSPDRAPREPDTA